MKSLIDFINENNIKINDSLDLHFYAEFVLNESFKKSYFVITEKYGSYIGQKELIIDLSKEIWLTIFNNEPEDEFVLNKEDLSDYNNIFFNELIITLNNRESSYIPNKSKFNNNTKLFDKVFINVCYSHINDYTDVCSILMHELLHAYDDYKSYLSNSNYNLSDLTGKNSSYSKTIFNDNKITVETICKRILNNIRQWEQNAYIGELSIELDKHNFDISKYHTVQDAYKAAKELFITSDVWKQYSKLWNALNVINKNKSYQDEFTNTYNTINNTNLTFNKIYKKLDDIFNKILKKIERKIPKIFYDYYQEKLNQSLHENNSISGRQSMSLIEFLEYCNNYMMLESVKPDNGKPWEVYLNNSLDKTFTEWAQKWKKQPKIGNGFYVGGTIFKIIRIDNNKVYVKEDNTIKP